MSTNKVIFFVLGMTVLVALLLAGFKTATQDIAAKNEDIFNKRQILLAIANPLEAAGKPLASLSDEEVLAIFEEQVDQTIVDADGDPMDMPGMKAVNIDMAKELKKEPEERMYPVYKVNLDSDAYYIFSVRGSGLWDAIWGNVALESDLNTIAGVSFDHAGETPGLGAEIKDNATWRAQFVGKKIYDGDKYVSIYVRKGGALDQEHEVDGLSGATITADGVTDMLYSGLKAYEPYMEEANASTSMNLK
ncbi:NADH:ubiquinone reductase (Na(+)-transporting) subunit C [Lewinella sp. 4G2]|uniref:NADH:ubiquinone reductase (Na(+)-transporting) subunit C n=1 Tax=Lewinella sp. 4G2 TaxID=1803372 RepID=UPI0007B4612B|nr:NADH:ubiquinone reductase (Na(+)-transporting) subunit C [Lewinella sp. 4G2]OAV43083.1 NADH:ubiquinone reductase (Na(+)-transporting) subunit C [Lewinella sp. 4G2]